jgi:hypothetical protein
LKRSLDTRPDGAHEQAVRVKKHLQIAEADARTRTGDPIITSDVLYQLSYVGEPSTLAGLLASSTWGEAVRQVVEPKRDLLPDRYVGEVGGA